MRIKELLINFFFTLAKLIPNNIIVPILVGPLRGSKIITGAPAGEGKGLSLVLNLSEPKKLQMIGELVSPNDIIFDIGANVGIYSLIFSKFCKKVYAFEPVPRNIYFLQRILNLNDIKNVNIIKKAVSDKNGMVPFRKGKSYATGSINEEGHTIVPSITLDSFCQSQKIEPNFLKIDVEGAELFVLKGAKKTLSEYKPIILMEIHGVNLKNKSFKLLKSFGYNYFKLIMFDKSQDIKEFLILETRNSIN